MILPFEEQYKKKYFDLLDQVFKSNVLSDGKMLRTFEENFSKYSSLPSKALVNGGAALLAILKWIDVADKEVIVPANTFWATPLSVKLAGGKIVYADCSRNDLCLNLKSIKDKLSSNTKAVIVVHIGGHISFEIEEIKQFCDEKGIFLVEDCAHSHGAEFNGKMAGSWGIAGAYSFYATKTMPMGEGGMVVSKDPNLLCWVEKFRNYGKEIVNGKVEYPVKDSFNYRMSEQMAAFGIVQLERLPMILEWKRRLAFKYDQIFNNSSCTSIRFPKEMKSGYYKYIVFCKDLKYKTGKVYDLSDQCHRIENVQVDLPNTEWVGVNHQCPPMYYGWEHAEKEVEQICNLYSIS
ncbi:MAG: aminotransferase class I/II-fold pyridoxal phosphate-dependent enzyme [Candidatus Riflebacteria bacterium]|nr:aminotransferase class I/II-fold pyridoxal phosphate-dependent enzyme [Candidatus Riflebacteria bacterium]